MSTSQPGPGRRRKPQTPEEEYLQRLNEASSAASASRASGHSGTSAGGAISTRPDVPPVHLSPTPVVSEKRPRSGASGLVVGLAVLLAVLVLYCGALALGWLGTDGVGDLGSADEEASAARASQASAERAAEAVLAYDFRSLEEDRDAALRFLTEEYGADYAATFDSTVTEVAQQTRARVSVEVQGSAVVDATADTAKVLLFVDQTTVSTASEQPRVALNRVEMEMVERDGTWLVDDILSF